MDLNTLKSIFNERIPGPEGDSKTFSVLVPLMEINHELNLLFEIRSENLKTQPREICFPGGKIEPGETPLECAIRETCEELNIKSHNISILGPLDYLSLPYNLILYPYLGTINIDLESINYSRDEVSSIFYVPLNYFVENSPSNHPIEIQTLTGKDFPYHLLENGEDYKWRSGEYPVYFYQYNDYVIWGMTARIIKNLIDLTKPL